MVLSREKVAALAVALSLACGTAISVAQQKGEKSPAAPKSQSVEVPAKSAAAGTKDPNVRSAEPRRNDPDAERPAPPNKGGQERGQVHGWYCDIVLENWTPWYVNIYIDGNWDGTLQPWANVTTYAWPGATTIYARADFNDGSYKWWGPWSFPCPEYGSYNWKLRP